MVIMIIILNMIIEIIIIIVKNHHGNHNITAAYWERRNEIISPAEENIAFASMCSFRNILLSWHTPFVNFSLRNVCNSAQFSQNIDLRNRFDESKPISNSSHWRKNPLESSCGHFEHYNDQRNTVWCLFPFFCQLPPWIHWNREKKVLFLFQSRIRISCIE